MESMKVLQVILLFSYVYLELSPFLVSFLFFFPLLLPLDFLLQHWDRHN